jgi:Arc/MetJ-type ribon-helix-helix transcriptional regulator
MTFTLDEQSVQELNLSATRESETKSQVLPASCARPWMAQAEFGLIRTRLTNRTKLNELHMAVKMTFTLDEATVDRINRVAARLAKPKSEVVREAIREYETKSDRLSEEERTRMLRIVDQIAKRPPTRTQGEVDREIAEIRRARRSGGRLHPVE